MTQRVDVAATRRRRRAGLEDAARAERLAFLRSVAADHGTDTIALAHTRDDQAETLLLRLLRGAGSTGLGAMSRRHGDLWRPLLEIARHDVLRHLQANGLDWREDASNGDLSLSRNRVRRELLPYLERHFNPAVREVLARSAGLLSDDAAWIDGEARRVFERAARPEGDGWLVSGALLREADPALSRAVLRRALSVSGGLHGVSLRHVDTLLSGIRNRASSSRPVALPGGRVGVFRFGDLWLGARRRPARHFDLPLGVPGRVRLPDGRVMEARRAPGPARADESAAVIPLPREGLVVRSRRPGDRVRRRGRVVSLKRFLMERRVPADVRAELPLVASGARVLWVPGQPLDTDEQAARAEFVRVALTRVS